VNRQRQMLGPATGQDLLTSQGGIGSGVEESAAEQRSTQAVPLDQMAQGLLGLDVEDIDQFRGVVAVEGGSDQGFHGVQQGAITREPDAMLEPQAEGIKARYFPQRVEASAMAVASEITELPQFTEDGEVDRGAQDAFELRQIGDLVADQVAAEGQGVKSSGSHYVRIPTVGFLSP
jgi:hypothetical protein